MKAFIKRNGIWVEVDLDILKKTKRGWFQLQTPIVQRKNNGKWK